MSIGQSFMYLQDYNKARHATRILNYLLTRKSEIDSASPYGAKPVSTSTCYTILSNLKFDN